MNIVRKQLKLVTDDRMAQAAVKALDAGLMQAS
jgi:hypothetical protein